ncbi:MAG: TIGR03435 family protein [Bryobacteraceae bacterium]
MRLTILACGLAAQSYLTVFGQSAAGHPAFDVASIKPAAAQTPGRMMMGCGGGPGTPDPGRLTCTNANLSMLMTRAYGVQGYQITSPDWFNSEHFDITAKIPAGATKEQFNLMLQNLLAERFQVKLHRETKELPIYALVVGKGGPKLKPSEEAPPADAPKEGPPADGGPMGPPKRGPDGFPQLPRGGRGMMMMMQPGRLRLAGSQQTTSDLANILSGQLGRPVRDETGLKGKYDFTLDFAPEPGQGPMGGMMMPMPPPGGGTMSGGGPASDSQEGGPPLITAVQEQLGLKLESKKGPVQILVIDHAEKAPTEN